jgi:hypothetical protein
MCDVQCLVEVPVVRGEWRVMWCVVVCVVQVSVCDVW